RGSKRPTEMSISKGRRRRQPASVTGRDGYLVLQALAYTILTIEALPKCQQEWSNKEDMKALLHVLSRGDSEYYPRQAPHRRHSATSFRLERERPRLDAK